VIVRGGFGFYDPVWGYPYYYGAYPYYDRYPYYYGEPIYGVDRTVGDIKTEVKPKETEIYVDGYYAGVADNFDGVFQRLHTSPGGHEITLRLDGYRTITQNVYVAGGSTTKVTGTLEKLAPGEVSAPVPLPALPPKGGTQPQH
jgi:hypothetical protein